jgi:hypothetical protein
MEATHATRLNQRVIQVLIARRRTVGTLLRLLAMSLVLLAGAVGFHVWWEQSGGSRGVPIYSLAALRANLESDPTNWLGRTARVHAIPVLQWCFVWTVPSPRCALQEPALVSPKTNTDAPLPLAWGSAPPLLAFLRQVPLLGAVAPPPQVIQWARPGIYRVQVLVASCFAVGMGPCYKATVLDSSP